MLLKFHHILKFHRRNKKLTLLCYSETERVVEALLVSDVTSDTFRLDWVTEEDAFDTFVLMVS